jgi:hypothetical protein
MPWSVGLVLRLILHAGAIVVGAVVSMLGVAGVIIALAGTGALTSSPPPEHPRYGAALIVIVLWAAVAMTIFYGWRTLVRMIDRAEAG